MTLLSPRHPHELIENLLRNTRHPDRSAAMQALSQTTVAYVGVEVTLIHGRRGREHARR